MKCPDLCDVDGGCRDKTAATLLYKTISAGELGRVGAMWKEQAETYVKVDNATFHSGLLVTRRPGMTGDDVIVVVFAPAESSGVGRGHFLRSGMPHCS